LAATRQLCLSFVIARAVTRNSTLVTKANLEQLQGAVATYLVNIWCDNMLD
jgi:hypothetical protein